MTPEMPMLAYGNLLISQHSDGIPVRFDVFSDGIKFYHPRSSPEPADFFGLVAGLTNPASSPLITGQGHLTLIGLPASPRPVFDQVTLQYDVDGDPTTFSLQVVHPDPFACQAGLFFKNLDLRLTERQATHQLSVAGGVDVVLFDQDIHLDAELSVDGLVFRNSGQPSLVIEQLGALSLTTFQVGPDQARRPGPQVLYAFDEGAGAVIHDSSGVGDPLDLQIDLPEAVEWRPGGLAVTETPPIRSGGPATKLIDACRSTAEITLETWLKPADIGQKGPARIVTISKNPRTRNFTLGHELQHRQKGACYVVRTRIKGGTDHNGQPSLNSPEGSLTTGLQYVVYTRDAAGNDRLYLNGRLQADRKVKGDLSNWDESYELALANELTNNRPWQGELHRVAIYDRALTPSAVQQSYYPAIRARGVLTLTDVPVPLSEPTEVELAFLPDQELPAIQAEQTLFSIDRTGAMRYELTCSAKPVTPFLHFERLHLVWQKTPGSSWKVSGIVAAALWENPPLDLTVRTTDREGVQIITLQNRRRFELTLAGLGELTFQNFALHTAFVDGLATWTIAAETNMDALILPPVPRPYDRRTDFQLLEPHLALQDGQLTLVGRWLGEEIVLHGVRRDEHFALQGTITFRLPFDLTLGPIYEPHSGLKVADQIRVCQGENCWQMMTIALRAEVSASGFLARVKGRFQWQDESNTLHDIAGPEILLDTPPTTRNALLVRLIEALKSQANQIFAEKIKHVADYYFTTREAKPLIYYGASATEEPTEITSILPALFEAPLSAPLTSNEGIFTLESLVGTGQRLIIRACDVEQDKIQADYEDFLAQLEQVPRTGLLPGAANLIMTRIAERLPMTLDRVLYYYYGFDPTHTYLDLKGGMRLRVDYQTYQFVSPADRTASNGFVGSGSSYYQLNSYLHPTNSGANHYLLGFDSFLSGLQTVVTTDVAQDGAGGIIDLLRAGYRRPYYRLFYPSQFSDPAGRIGPERVATLIGADSLTDMRAATEVYLTQNGELPDPDSDNSRVSLYLRGRATVIPEITVFVHERPLYVPLGTTVRQLAERYSNIPAALPGQDLRQFQGRLRPRRVVHEGLDSTPTYHFLNLNQVRVSTSGLDEFDLPVVKGDRFYF